jgi:hypothetical protein
MPVAHRAGSAALLEPLLRLILGPRRYCSLKQRPEDGKYELELSYPHTYPVLKLCSVVDTRRQVEKAFNSRYVLLKVNQPHCRATM